MKKPLAVILLAGLLTIAGCVTIQEPGFTLAPVPPIAAKTFPAVTPEQATERNGHPIAQALMDEMDREAQQNLLTTSPR